jgi:hypothetical protein
MVLVVAGAPGCLDEIFGGPVRHTDYLENDQYATWVIEIDHVDGHAPSSEAISTLKARLSQLVNKAVIDVRVDDAVRGKATWTTGDIAALEAQYKDAQTGDATVVTWVAYLDGEFEQGNVAGVTIGYDRIAIFAEAIDGACSLGTLCFGQDTEVERAVLVHEFGHALGLVDRGAKMQTPHEDEEHEGHSSNRNSVMWWQVESIGQLPLLSTIPTTFDANDKADLCAAGGRCP